MRSLSMREKVLAGAVGLFVIVVAVDRLVIAPTRERIDTLTRVVPEKVHALQTLQRQAQKAQQLQAAFADAQEMSIVEDVQPLLPMMEHVLRQAGLDQHIKTLQEQRLPMADGFVEEGLEMHLANLPAQSVVDLLLDIHEAHQHLCIKRLKLNRSAQTPGMVHCELYWARVVAPTEDATNVAIN